MESADYSRKSIEQRLNEIGITVGPRIENNPRRKLFKGGVEIDRCTASEATEKYLKNKS